jgi:hypothetical protein
LIKRDRNGLIERIIENWLTNTNERGYEIPFCQYLISKGHTILGISFHGPLEQGKDIIALDETGFPCAYQLKSGNITERVWREIKGEIDELVEIPIKHPKVNNTLKHRCIFVTNGNINDVVKTNITDRNVRYKEVGQPLEIIAGQELLKMFLDVTGTFLPRQISDFRTFVEILLVEGTENLNKELFSTFLESILLTNGDSPTELRRKISSSVVLTQYVLSPYESRENHISTIEGWTILCSYILGLVEKYELENKNWFQSYNLVLEKINYHLDALKKEFFSRTDYTEIWDCELFYKARITTVLGWLSASELYLKKSDSDYKIDARVCDSIREFYGTVTWFWGESATPLFIMMSKLLYDANEKELSNKIICDLIIEITNRNNFREKDGLPDPYYSSKQVINHFYGPPDAQLDLSSFSGSSYHLSTLVDILVRRNRRDLLNEIWKKCSYLINSEFKPNSLWEIVRWRSNEGKQIDNFYKNPQSWNELREKALEMDDNKNPKILQKLPFVYYFSVCYPHRLNRNTNKLLD